MCLMLFNCECTYLRASRPDCVGGLVQVILNRFLPRVRGGVAGGGSGGGGDAARSAAAAASLAKEDEHLVNAIVDHGSNGVAAAGAVPTVVGSGYDPVSLTRDMMRHADSAVSLTGQVPGY